MHSGLVGVLQTRLALGILEDLSSPSTLGVWFSLRHRLSTSDHTSGIFYQIGIGLRIVSEVGTRTILAVSQLDLVGYPSRHSIGSIRIRSFFLSPISVSPAFYTTSDSIDFGFFTACLLLWLFSALYISLLRHLFQLGGLSDSATLVVSFDGGCFSTWCAYSSTVSPFLYCMSRQRSQ